MRLRNGRDRTLTDNALKTFRIYVEWCPNGDLTALLYQYRERLLYEPLVWCVAESLVDCAKAMEDGHTRPNQRVPEWRSNVHKLVRPHPTCCAFARD